MRIGTLLPLLGLLVVGSLPLVRHVQKNAAEARAADALHRVSLAQQSFRQAAGGYASDLASLTMPCPDHSTVALDARVLDDLRQAGYALTLRPRQDARTIGADCHRRRLVSDYYAAVQPESANTAGQQAFALTSRGRIYVFYDGVPPRERDMGLGGLAIPLDAAATFKIP